MRPTDTRTLDLGCGRRKHRGAFGIDIREGSDADLIRDVEETPYPLPSDHYTMIYCHHVVEHVRDVALFLREIHRVSAPGALIELKTPHFSSWYAYNDPTHVHTLGYFFLDHFTIGDFRKRVAPASPALFQYVTRRLLFSRAHRRSGVSLLANRFPSYYEQLFCFLFPCKEIVFQLTPIK